MMRIAAGEQALLQAWSGEEPMRGTKCAGLKAGCSTSANKFSDHHSTFCVGLTLCDQTLIA
jgi:hypothetical protein